MTKTSFYYSQITIGQLIDSLSKKYEINFAYNAGVIDLDSIVSVKANDVPLNQWIVSFFSSSYTDVFINDKQVVICSKTEAGTTNNSNNNIRVSGKVEDYSYLRPVPMVNIGVVNLPVGTVTNDQGAFEIILPLEYAGETLSFSHLGFLSKKIIIPDKDTTIVISLHETSVILPEVEVKYMSPLKIISKMVKEIPGNYPDASFFLTAFFRETIRQDGRFVDVSEAVVEIMKPSYRTGIESEKVKFIKGRKGKEVSEMDLVNFKLEGGPFHFSRLDVVRNRNFVPDENSVSEYTYSFEGFDTEHDRMVYRIKFKPVNDTGELFYQGEFRIDSKSYALVSAIFELTPASIKRSKNYLIKRDSRRFKARPYFARYQVDYRPWGDLWVLHRVRGEVSLRIVDKSRRERSDIQTVSEMLVSDFKPAENRDRLKWVETFKSDYILSERIGDFDFDFWKNFNIIRPDEALEKVFYSEK
ncbi:MAG: carboxypeptidase-like regulatory domain-containing protein [Candidatus Lokiarchaeota archaeon]|nr:carboxypeptidase-like regulatory domain-containing protein [Candidatus Lokiarchaeota archaeon]